mmetsp:Transcript_43419/g.97740  ORF Transcript_43419/g.97740 Transcript_43419/m.97740 type:complete len:117 (+) Transcript_43419:728-1078(+)
MTPSFFDLTRRSRSAGVFFSGQRVRVREPGGEWRTGTVSAALPLRVRVDGWDRPYRWTTVMPVAVVGDRVKCRDTVEDAWRHGWVVCHRPTQVLVDGWAKPYAFREVIKVEVAKPA